MIARGGIALVVTALAVGCSGQPTELPRATSGDLAAAAPVLKPVVLPDLSALAESVQRQVSDRYAALNAILRDPSATAAAQAAAYGDLGRLFMAASFGDEAATCFLHAEALAPRNMRWPYYLGHAYLMRGNRQGAAQAFERASALEPANLPAMIWLAETYLDEGRPDAAQSAFGRALSVQPRSAAALFGAGRAALARQAYEDAVRYFEQALDVDGHASAIQYPLAMAYRALGKREQAEAHLRRRGDGWPDLPDPLMQQPDEVLDSPVAYEHRGRRALDDRDWTAAAAAFRRGLELAPGDAELRYWLGATLSASGDLAAAEKEFRDLVRQSPRYAKAHFSLGALLELRGLRAEAAQEYGAAVESDPTLVDARLRLAEALRDEGRLTSSLDQYEQTIDRDPRVLAAWLGGLQVLVDLKRSGDAADWLARARRVFPDQPDLVAWESRLPHP